MTRDGYSRGIEQLVAMNRAARGEPAFVTLVPGREASPGWLPADAPLPPGFAASASWPRTPTQSGRVGEIIPTEAKVADEITKLERDYVCLDITFKTAPLVDPNNPQETGFRQGWDAALGAWRKFVRDNPATGWRGLGVYATGTSNLIRSINDYRNTLVAWDKAFRERYPAAATVCPAPASPGPVPGLFGTEKPPDDKPGLDLPWYVTSALTVAAVGGAAYLVYATYKYVTDRTKDVEYVRHEIVPRALTLRSPAPTSSGSHDRDREHGDREPQRYQYAGDLDPSPHLPYPT